MIGRIGRFIGILFLTFLLLSMFSRPSVASQVKTGAQCSGLIQKLIDLNEHKQETGKIAALNSFLNRVTRRDRKAETAYQEVVKAEKEVARARKELEIVSKKQLPEKEKIIENYKAKKVVEEAEKKLDEAKKKKSAAEIALRFSAAKLKTISASAVGGYLGIAAVLGLGVAMGLTPDELADDSLLPIKLGLAWPFIVGSPLLGVVWWSFGEEKSKAIAARLEAEAELGKALQEQRELLQQVLSTKERIIKEYLIKQKIKKAQAVLYELLSKKGIVGH